MTGPFLVHGTAIVAGNTGMIFIGPSGSGKTRLALATMQGAKRAGHFAALVSDDQVLLQNVNGHLIARAPETIRGLAEIRGSAIVQMETIAAAKLDFAVRSTDPAQDQRLPDARESAQLAQGAMIPLLRLPIDCIDPFENLRLIFAAYVTEKNV